MKFVGSSKQRFMISEIIAVTNLNFLAVLQLLWMTKISTILYFKKNIPNFLFRLLKKKFLLRECSFNYYPEYFEDTEKEIYNFSNSLMINKKLLNLVKNMAKILCIEKSHIEYAIIKHFIKILRGDIALLHLVKLNYKNYENIRYLFENYHLINRLSNLNSNLIKSNQVRFYYIIYVCYLFIWVFNILKFFLNKLIKKNKTDNRNIIFQQKYSYRFQGNPEFESFYRYFRTRDDVGYHCRKRKDNIYRSLLSEGKPVFTNHDLSVSKSETFLLYSILIKMVILLFKYRITDIVFFYIALSIFKEYVIIRCLMLEFSPKYFIRIRPDGYENHPITTGVCDSLRCLHVGYHHCPPVYFQAYYAVMDFHFLGVLGKTVIEEVYKQSCSNANWSVMGPITAEICHDIQLKKNDCTRHVTFFATSPVNDVNDELFKKAFSQLAVFLNGRKNFKLIYRDKMILPGRLEFVQEHCRKNNINFDIELSSKGTNLKGYSSYTIMASDLVVICSISTAAWECLSLRKKIIVFPDEWNKHPLENFEPNLTARSNEEFKKRMEWLIDIPQVEYNTQINHIVEKLSKLSNGNMTKEFFIDFVGLDGVKRNIY